MAFVYIMANKRYGTIYVGVTGDVARRAFEHRNHLLPGFTGHYDVTKLVWYEEHQEIATAIQREHNMKHWKREWKTALVDAMNPDWDALPYAQRIAARPAGWPGQARP